MAWYQVQVLLKDGRSVSSPGMDDRAAAEAEVSEIADAMRAEGVVKRPWAAVDSGASIYAVQLLESSGYNPAARQ